MLNNVRFEGLKPASYTKVNHILELHHFTVYALNKSFSIISEHVADFCCDKCIIKNIETTDLFNNACS